ARRLGVPSVSYLRIGEQLLRSVLWPRVRMGGVSESFSNSLLAPSPPRAESGRFIHSGRIEQFRGGRTAERNSARRIGGASVSMTLSVVIPVYNEARTISTLIERVLKAPTGLRREIIVVDDASTDGTRELLSSVITGEIRLVVHDVNRGKGAAIRT